MRSYGVRCTHASAGDTDIAAMPPLFTISTDRLHLAWDGPAAPPDASAPAGCLRVQPLRLGLAPHIEVGGEGVTDGAALRLAEQTAYRVFVRSRNGTPVSLRQGDPLTLRALVADDAGAILSGAVDFGGQIGRSRFVALADGKEEVAFEVEVFPAKASFAEVETMREELDQALAGLAFEYLRATATMVGPAPPPPHRATWLTLMHHVLPDLEAALRYISARPLRDLAHSIRLRRTEQVRHPDATVRRAVLRGDGSGERLLLQSGRITRSVLPEHRASETLSTSEHRWIRQQLRSAQTTLAILQRDEARLPHSARRRQVLADIAGVERRLARLLQARPLEDASEGALVALPSQRLVTAPGYAEAYRALQQLTLSLTLAEGAVPHATRDLHHLYEMWCYLAVLRETAALVGQPIQARGFFRVEHRGVRLMLRHGHRHGVSFDTGARRVSVTYNPRFPARRGLLAQRPDILLTVEGSTTRHFVLDAKYRRDDSAGHRRRFGAPGPSEDALGDLHRYRDAIRDRRGERIVEQAVALYPYRADDAYAESKLWSAIGRVGVGAIPLVPGRTEYLTRWLEGVLSD